MQFKKVDGIFTTIRPTSPIPATYQGLPLDQDDWTCADWVTYYKRIKSSLGKEKAVQIVNTDSDRIGLWATSQTCKYDCTWYNYFKNEGVNTGANIFSNLYCTASNVAETGQDITRPGFLKPIIVGGAIIAGLYFANKAGLFDKLKKKRR